MIVKKYPNRRLYDTSRSVYINLEELAGLVRAGHEVQVVDAKTGEDLTRDVLLQVVLEVLKGAELLPIGMLRRMIRASGDDPASRMLRAQLSTGLELMSRQLDQLEGVFRKPAPPPPPHSQGPQPDPEEPGTDEEPDAELTALRARLDALEARLQRD